MGYQVRLSYETAIMLEELKQIYENRERKPVTKGEVLNNAYYDTKDVDSWLSIYEKKIPLKDTYEIKENALRPRLQITNEVEQGIKELKIEIAKELGLRSVTIGVVIKLIMKAALLKYSLDESKAESINRIFEKYKNQVSNNFSEDNAIQMLKVLNSIEAEIEPFIDLD